MSSASQNNTRVRHTTVQRAKLKDQKLFFGSFLGLLNDRTIPARSVQTSDLLTWKEQTNQKAEQRNCEDIL